MTPRLIRRLGLLTAASAAVLLAACGGGSGPAPVSPSEARSARASSEQASTDGASTRAPNGAYVVQLAEAPVSAYDGGVKGLAATRPKKGQKIDPNSPAVVDYLAFLKGRHDAVLGAVGGGKKLYSYGFVFNGFAAKLTDEQAQKLQAMRGVLAVTPDEIHQANTSSTPAFLGLSGPTGFWQTAGAKGEGVIIGIIDSGIWPEHPSFSDRTDLNGNQTKDGKLGYQQIPGWNGRCQIGQAWVGSNCNQKLIGARYFNEGHGGDAGIRADRPWEFVSARDYNNHGTHTASTAGGNANVPATGPAAVFGAISGIAPRARIAAYKALWSTQSGDTASGTTSDLVAAIDAAVADGVDVINYSISGSTSNFRDPAEIAFLYAADAGVFVAASAGNSGPTSGTVAHPSPWITTVAAGTHNRNGSGSVTLGNGATYFGASVATAAGPAPLIAASAAGLPGANAAQLALCYSSADGATVLDPAKVAGKIVVCDRGVTARVNKSLAVMEAGGVGMILANTSPNSLNADFHYVPTVHVQNTDRAAILAYAATAGATSTINAATIVYTEPAPFTASFSSRGPLTAGGGDLLKPDLIAPGQDILAGVAPVLAGRLFDLLSGTSMSSPHVAGLAALFKEAKPGWSPMAIKSALMTTGSDVLDGGTPAPNTNPVLIFRQGAGHVQPSSALNPGLVYDSGWNDWIAFICAAQGAGLDALCASYPKIDPSDLNMASIAIGDMAGVQTVKRRVTNVSGGPLTVAASLTGMTGFSTTISPSSLTLAKGETKEFTVSFLRTSATLNAYTGGQLTWSGGGISVRSPVVVRPVALAAPTSVSSSGGAVAYNVTFGYDGPFTATPRGLVASAITADTVADDPSDGTCSLNSPNAKLIPVVVPAGTTYARFALFDADVNPGSDIDLCVFRGSTQVGSSGSGTSAEEVNLTNPAADTYTVVVQGWGVAGSTPFKLHTWLLGVADAGNMAVSAPAAAVTGGTGNISLAFSGLAAGAKYLGSVAYGGASGLPNPTIVRVDAP